MTIQVTHITAYIINHPGNIVARVIEKYSCVPEISLNYGLILREFSKYPELCKYVLEQEILYSLFLIARENSI